ncbi:hypothetical protein KHS38_12075 [Mucilaginibacter sp. Bleaf8]|uniref:hypothetical protein n=1 Tax=Mucilaginibacter sp. Bleaf8 TaxID=2834430 RepID=UPI001BCD2EEF|nr:hypothetical protein [Mucilaginibacter sp. Bleaf8]MBS7565142.1 hypothetical protein [Mucilaginibacter sp. Bleaf8]
MSGKKVVIVGDSLVGALAAILAKTEGSEVHVQLVEFEGQLKEFLDQPATVDLTAELETWKSNFADLQEEFDEYKEVAEPTIAELKLQLNDALTIKEQSSSKRVVTVDGQKFVVNHGAHPYSAKEIAADPGIAKAILKIKGQQALTKL